MNADFAIGAGQSQSKLNSNMLKSWPNEVIES